MSRLVQVIPEPRLLVELEPEELAAKLLFVLRADDQEMFSRDRVVAAAYGELGPGRCYPAPSRAMVDLAIREAWAWLEAQGLVIPAAGPNGQNGYRVLSRRAARFQDEDEFTGFVAARALPRELLHPSIASRVWASFVRGEYDGAVHTALREVEIAVRAATTDQTGYGVQLMRSAFRPHTGEFSDAEADAAEQEAMASLFSGAIGVFKNPQSHRNVNLDDPGEAVRILMLASELLRIVDARRAHRSN